MGLQVCLLYKRKRKTISKSKKVMCKWFVQDIFCTGHYNHPIKRKKLTPYFDSYLPIKSCGRDTVSASPAH